jgi:hypothetical protein
MDSAADTIKKAAHYITTLNGDQTGIDRLTPLIKPGFNAKIIGFLFYKSSNRKLTANNFAAIFTNAELTQLYNDIKEADKKNRRESLEPNAEREMLETLFRYSSVLGFLS